MNEQQRDAGGQELGLTPAGTFSGATIEKVVRIAGEFGDYLENEIWGIEQNLNIRSTEEQDAAIHSIFESKRNRFAERRMDAEFAENVFEAAQKVGAALAVQKAASMFVEYGREAFRKVSKALEAEGIFTANKRHLIIVSDRSPHEGFGNVLDTNENFISITSSIAQVAANASAVLNSIAAASVVYKIKDKTTAAHVFSSNQNFRRIAGAAKRIGALVAKEANGNIQANSYLILAADKFAPLRPDKAVLASAHASNTAELTRKLTGHFAANAGEIAYLIPLIATNNSIAAWHAHVDRETKNPIDNVTNESINAAFTANNLLSDAVARISNVATRAHECAEGIAEAISNDSISDGIATNKQRFKEIAGNDGDGATYNFTVQHFSIDRNTFRSMVVAAIECNSTAAGKITDSAGNVAAVDLDDLVHLLQAQ